MAKKNKNQAAAVRDSEDGVVRVVTDDTPTIQASLPAGDADPFDAFMEPLSPLIEESSALAPPMTLDSGVELTPTALGAFPPPPAFPPLSSVDDPIDADHTGVIAHEIMALKPTEPLPASLAAEDLFNPRVWELEQKVQDLTSRIDVESALHIAKMSEMMSQTERLIQDLRVCRLWSLRTKSEANILVLAHDAIEATHKAVAVRGFAAGDIVEARAISDRVII